MADDVIQKVKSGTAWQGSITKGILPTGPVGSGAINHDPAYSWSDGVIDRIEDKLTNRFDDTTYYTA